MSRFRLWAEREYSEKQRIFTLLGLALIFPIAIPLFLFFVPPNIDRYFGLSRFDFGTVNIVVGILLIMAGSIFALWSNYVQFTIGRGTPLPMMPTQKLIVCAPYTYCRNPMLLGAIFLYLGIAVWMGSLSAVVMVILFALILATYIKLIEEIELAERYGSEYLEYKRRTPFLVPRLWKRG